MTTPIVEKKGRPRYEALANGHNYSFVGRDGVALAEVEDGDVAMILAIKHGCCGRSRKTYRLATDGEYERWKSTT